MDSDDRNTFISSYTKLLLATWSDESLGGRLVADPKAVLAQFGLVVPADAKVNLVRQIPPDHGEVDVDVQVRLWEKGLQTGEFEMHVPETPQIDMAELSDSELESVSGGVSVAAGSVREESSGFTISRCCCCPCCSCA